MTAKVFGTARLRDYQHGKCRVTIGHSLPGNVAGPILHTAAVMVLTTSSLFLHTLAQVGINHVFVNWGSDHPALLEELEHQRAMYGAHTPTIMTSSNEMVALSATQGYTQVTSKPAAIIVHVDVGTQVSCPRLNLYLEVLMVV